MTRRPFHYPDKDYYTFAEIVSVNPQLQVAHFKQSTLRLRVRKLLQSGELKVIDIVWKGSHRRYIYAQKGKGLTYPRPQPNFRFPPEGVLFTFQTFIELNLTKSIYSLRLKMVNERRKGRIRIVARVGGHTSLYAIDNSCSQKLRRKEIFQLPASKCFTLEEIIKLNPLKASSYVYDRLNQYCRQGYLVREDKKKQIYSLNLWDNASCCICLSTPEPIQPQITFNNRMELRNAVKQRVADLFKDTKRLNDLLLAANDLNVSKEDLV